MASSVQKFPGNRQGLVNEWGHRHLQIFWDELLNQGQIFSLSSAHHQAVLTKLILCICDVNLNITRWNEDLRKCVTEIRMRLTQHLEGVGIIRLAAPGSKRGAREENITHYYERITASDFNRIAAEVTSHGTLIKWGEAVIGAPLIKRLEDLKRSASDHAVNKAGGVQPLFLQ